MFEYRNKNKKKTKQDKKDNATVKKPANNLNINVYV
jgi:hypothetical protein